MQVVFTIDLKLMRFVSSCMLHHVAYCKLPQVRNLAIHMQKSTLLLASYIYSILMAY